MNFIIKSKNLQQIQNLAKKQIFQFGNKLNNGKQITELRIGDYVENIKSYSQKDINGFADLVGDRSPIHLDPEYAATTIFKKPIVYGFQTGAMFSNLIGNNLPGAIYLNQTLHFKAPVYIDEVVETRVEVKEVNTRSKKLVLITTVKKVVEDKIAIEGEAQVYYKNINDIFKA